MRFETEGKAPTILVADDDPAIIHLIIAVLCEHGYRVVPANNGSEALEVAANHSASLDLLLSDVYMPDMLGDALWLELKQWYPHAKVLLMSGSAEPLAVGGLPFLRKPFGPSELVCAVQFALGNYQPEA